VWPIVLVTLPLQDAQRHDMGQGEDTQAARLDGVWPPAHEVALRAARLQPAGERLQIGRPLVACSVRHDEVAEHVVQLAAQTGDERGVAPAWFQLPPRCDRRPPSEDVGIRALQAEERDLKSQPQQPARGAEVVVGRGGQQVHAGGIALQQHQHVALEGFSVDAEAQPDSADQVVVGGEQLVDRQGSEAGIGGGIGVA
jgi:hypothetical protein